MSLVVAAVLFAAGLVDAAEDVVTARESRVRSAPFDVAPEEARVHAGDRLPAAEQPEGDWRRVQLPDGRYGFLRDVDVQVIHGSASATAFVAGGSQPARAAEPTNGPTLLGVMFELLPVGTLRGTSPTGSQSSNASADSVFAVAVAPFVDLAVTPYFAIGLSPQVIFRVNGVGSGGQSATEIDLRARVTGRLPMSPRVRTYGRLSPAYSIISTPGGTSRFTSLSDPSGVAFDFAVGIEVALLPNLFGVVDLGYQVGFQSSSASTGEGSFDGTNYLHLGGGLAIGL